MDQSAFRGVISTIDNVTDRIKKLFPQPDLVEIEAAPQLHSTEF